MGNNRDTQKWYQTFSGTDALVYLIMSKEAKATVLGAVSTISYSSYRVKRPVNVLGQIVSKSHTFGPRTIGGTLIFSVINSNFVEELLINNPWLRDHGHLKADELPLFDLMIVCGNEYGAYNQAFISGVSIVDEGQVVSVEDMFSENTFSFIAKDYIPFSDFGRNSVDPTAQTPYKDGGIVIPSTPVKTTPLQTEIWVNGKKISLVYGDIINKNGLNYVPLRDMFDALGWAVTWADETQTAIVKIGEYYLHVNPISGLVSGNFLDLGIKPKKASYTLNPKPMLVDTRTGRRTYVPIGQLFRDLGYTVNWDDKTRRISITGKAASGGVNEVLIFADIQEHLIRHGFPVAKASSWNAETKGQLKKLCEKYGMDPAKQISADYSVLGKDLQIALTRPTAGVVLKVPEVKTGKSNTNISIYVYNGTGSSVIATVAGKTAFTITEKMNGWLRISKPKLGWIQESAIL